MNPNLSHSSTTTRLVSVLFAFLITATSFGAVMVGLTGEDTSTVLAAASHPVSRDA